MSLCWPCPSSQTSSPKELCNLLGNKE